MLSGGQASGLAAQISVAGIDYVVIDIGGDDYAPNGTAWNGIYNGTWTQGQIDAYVNQTISNIDTGIDTLAAGTRILLATISGFGVTSATNVAFPDASKRELVDNVPKCIIWPSPILSRWRGPYSAPRQTRIPRFRSAA